MPKVAVCQQGFTADYVEQIRATIPAGWHMVLRRLSGPVAPYVLCSISGSPTQQKERCVKVRFGGGAAAGAITVPLGKLSELFASIGQR